MESRLLCENNNKKRKGSSTLIFQLYFHIYTYFSFVFCFAFKMMMLTHRLPTIFDISKKKIALNSIGTNIHYLYSASSIKKCILRSYFSPTCDRCNFICLQLDYLKRVFFRNSLAISSLAKISAQNKCLKSD